MRRIRLTPDYRSPGRIAAHVTLPWSEQESVLLRLPEALSHSQGFLFREGRAQDAWPSGMPAALPEWQLDAASGTLGYTCTLPGGIEFYAHLRPGRDEVSMVLGVRNGSSRPLSLLGASICAVLSGAAEFCDRSLARTSFLHAGKSRRLSETNPVPASMGRPPWIQCMVIGVPEMKPPQGAGWWVCRERADDGLVFVESREGGRFCAMIWGKAMCISASSLTPCIHSNPRLGECPPGGRAEQAGRLLLYEGRADLMCMRAVDGFS